MQLFSALEGSHWDNPLKDLSVRQDAEQGDQRDFPGQIGMVGNYATTVKFGWPYISFGWPCKIVKGA